MSSSLHILKRLRGKCVGVLCGGTSSERLVSLMSGKSVHKALRRNGLRVKLIDTAGRDSLCNLRKTVDIAYIALHGPGGEDGTVQGMLELMKIPYTGSGVLSSALSLDKIYAKEVLLMRRVPTPAFITADRKCIRERIARETEKRIKFPAVVKPARQGSTIGISVVRSKPAVKRALDRAFAYDTRALIERFIEGRELTVGILEDRPLPVMEIVSRNLYYDFEAKYKKGMSVHIVPADIPPLLFRRVQSIAMRAHEALGCLCVSRVDMMLDRRENIYVLEINTIPGMTETSLLPESARAAGIDFDALVLKILASAL